MADTNDNNTNPDNVNEDDNNNVAENTNKTPETPVVPQTGAKNEDTDLVAKIVNEKLEEHLKPIKSKLDNAYKARDEALAKVAAFEQAQREAQVQALKDEGKHREAWDMERAELTAKLETLEKRNTELSRDVAVKDALKGLRFRNDKAADMAFREITSNLVKDENGQWKHRSGISIKDYCDAFSKDDAQSFLFKANTNSGAGTSSGTANSGGPANAGPKSIFEMSQAEVLKRAQEGTLPTRNRK